MNELEERELLHKMFCTVHHNGGITISKAQEILGDWADADYILPMLEDRGILMLNGQRHYEFTAMGLQEFYRSYVVQRELRGEIEITDPTELVKALMVESARIAA